LLNIPIITSACINLALHDNIKLMANKVDIKLLLLRSNKGKAKHPFSDLLHDDSLPSAKESRPEFPLDDW
jgi:hypothetical protein